MNLLKKSWPILILLLLNLVLSFQNYRSGTFLTGWDNLHPEFNPGMNIQRSIFAVWQEYQGLGLLGGMGHASDLVHQIVVLLLSFLLPINLIRYLWTFLMLFLGSLGAYFFTKKILKKSNSISLIAGVFYLLNLATAQAFYTPWESFSTFFAALPWLLLTSLNFFEHRSKKNALILFLTLLLSTPAAYIPTIYLSFIFTLLIMAIVIGIGKKHLFRNLTKLGIFIFLVNAFWAIPFAYFTLTNSKTVVDAKINQMATETIFLQNKEFGNISDVMLLKGFWFNDVDPNKAGNFTYLLSPWRSYFANFHTDLIGFVLFAVIILGLIKAFKSKKRTELSIAILFIFSFVMLSTNTPPFSWIDEVFRKIPLFEQAFRFPFTKFSTVTSFAYALLFALGIELIAEKLGKRSLYFLLPISYILIAIFTFPMFDGHILYDKERLEIPKEYFQLFDYFKGQDQNARIANFPQYQFWGWNFYSWGYGGSGFLWYGIHQPILDRAFDVWGADNENYYFELSSALYAKDSRRFLGILNKYQVNFLLVDKNVINPSSPKSLFYSETQDLISHIPQITKVKSFGKIDVYKVNLSSKEKSFVFMASNLPSSNSYKWGDFDQAYLDLGNYVSVNSSQIGNSAQSAVYPFRSLFSDKEVNQQEFNIKENTDTFEISQKLTSVGTLNIPSYFQYEDTIPGRLTLTRANGKINLIFDAVGPTITIGQDKKENIARIQLLDSADNVRYPLTVITNGVSITNISEADLNKIYPVTFLVRDQNNSVVVKDAYGAIIAFAQIPPDVLKNITEFNSKQIQIRKEDLGKELKIEILKIRDPYISFSVDANSNVDIKNCDLFRKGDVKKTITLDGIQLYAKNASACLSFFNPNIPLNHSYILSLETSHQKGRQLLLWTLNEDEGFTPLSTYITENKQLFVLPPMEDYGQAYSVHIQSDSIGNDESINTFNHADMYFFPYSFLSAINVSQGDDKLSEVTNLDSTIIEHPNESIYVIKDLSQIKSSQALILSQSYDRGWTAYSVKGDSFWARALPFFFGKKLDNHVTVNNWENGWTIDNSLFINHSSLIIVYLPQYFEYLGFVVLLGTLAYLVLKPNRVI